MNAPVWLLLRGLTRDRRHWGDFPDRLAAALPPEARVVCIDLPGNGALHGLRSASHVPGLVAQARAQVAARGLAGRPVHLLAMSLGAMVAVAWAEAHPDEIAAAVLVNTSLRPFSPFWQRLRPRAWGPLLACLWPGTSAGRWERSILDLTSRLAVCRPESPVLLRHWTAWRASHPVSRANALRQLRAAVAFRAPREAPPVPLLLLSGAADGLVHPACSQALARAWGLPIAVHPGAGHDVPLDDPAWVVAQVVAWCPGVRRSSRPPP
ncbi:alpha/beta fold hydrolase [Sphaerotilus sp.]|uniref:alpha/beta fold hydrolase n=1 Tax=Sphaerotilus sp. TaxID=2093942 RepID=UPI0034E26074